jgi:hypothetical protein
VINAKAAHLTRTAGKVAGEGIAAYGGMWAGVFLGTGLLAAKVMRWAFLAFLGGTMIGVIACTILALALGHHDGAGVAWKNAGIFLAWNGIAFVGHYVLNQVIAGRFRLPKLAHFRGMILK